MKSFVLSFGLIIAVLAIAPERAAAQSFYDGKTVTIITGLTGGYDTYARILARHMPRFIPGKPSMIVKSMPGAGSMLAANHLYNVAVPDGLTFGIFARTVPMEPLLGDATARFAPEKFTWIGSASSFQDDAFVLMVLKKRNIATIDDLRRTKEPVRFGSTGPSAASDVGTRIIRDVLGLNIQLVRGYPGTDQTMLAVDREELDGIMVGISSLNSWRPNWISAGSPMNFILQYGYGGVGRHPLLANVPRIEELAANESDKNLFRFLEFPYKLARPYAGPPGIPADRVKILQDAFMATNRDKQYLDEAAKIGLDISPISGVEVGKIVSEAAGYPDSVIKRYSEILKKN